MTGITFTVEQIEIRSDGLAVLMHGRASGNIAPGMLLSIPFNNSFSAGCEISDVSTTANRTTLVLPADEPEEAEFLASFNPVGETLVVEGP